MTKNNFPAVLLWGGGNCFIKKICCFVTETLDKITEMCYNIDDDKTSSREPAREPEKESEEKMDMDGIRKLAMEHRDLELFERTRPREEARYDKALRTLSKFLRTPEHHIDGDVIDAIAMALDALTSEYFDKVERNGDKCRIMFAELDADAEDEN